MAPTKDAGRFDRVDLGLPDHFPFILPDMAIEMREWNAPSVSFCRVQPDRIIGIGQHLSKHSDAEAPGLPVAHSGFRLRADSCPRA